MHCSRHIPHTPTRIYRLELTRANDLRTLYLAEVTSHMELETLGVECSYDQLPGTIYNQFAQSVNDPAKYAIHLFSVSSGRFQFGSAYLVVFFLCSWNRCMCTMCVSFCNLSCMLYIYV